ncbi:conserved hypothetical protein [Bosea sp. 62]|uniref:hypothetical protein n=1 Tax=unclassified Bosea (in: a-proteobacteria) TaxID=2653178 RepID=UPI00125A9C16|nr:MULTISPECIES: hypothetical protein [unclassified Bosea (in: a-proteobacteria)]CAD5256797.1 conserved hypothetical protein [Bosea sp. 7B]CAD5273521.1 conserved hypothetical protein [Bosea sp. 21B]CAD5284581.1 conserved hypothetical protein [Bosea sp. 46]VVT60195.1 conserved hypothetical protein [Bosea sp. EC-HK365B]VXB58778.1 conserved hypothetical protein [Bosea sp. 62]
MTNRTTQISVHFSRPFLLPDFEAPLPAGEYRVDYDEVSIESTSRLAWRRVGGFINLPAIGLPESLQQMVPIEPAYLAAALEKDQRLP